MTTAGQPTGYFNQTYCVEFTVEGDLDGTTVSPPILDSPPTGANEGDPQGLFRRTVEALGLIDADYLVPVNEEDRRGSRGNRLITFLWIEGSSPGLPGATVDIVDAVEGGGGSVQKNIGPLGGVTTFFREGIFLPQGSMLRLGAMAGSAAEPIKVRLHIQFVNGARDLAAVLAAICCIEGEENGNGNGVQDADTNDFSVNAAAVDGGYADGSIVLRTGSVSLADNGVGAFNGGGAGNKSIFGAFGFDGLPIEDLTAIEYVWENVTGPGGPFFIPPGLATPLTPYCNLVVDFDPQGAGDLRVLSLMDDSLAGVITSSIGSYSNNGSNVLTYAWDGTTQNVLIVGPPLACPGPPAPGGVLPAICIGPLFTERAYSWQALIAANPDAVLRTVFTGDGGLPAGAITPSVLLVSGDSLNVTASGKKIRSFSVNGSPIFPAP